MVFLSLQSKVNIEHIQVISSWSLVVVFADCIADCIAVFLLDLMQ